MKNNYTIINKIIPDHKVRFLLTRLVYFWMMLQVGVMFSQNIPATLGTSTCGDCTPPGWSDMGGTPDMSDANNTGGQGTYGGGDAWNNAPLPLPPNGHTTWITIRDVGSLGTEESVGTTMTNLVAGREYEITVYYMTTTSPTYSPRYIDHFDYQVQGYSRVVVSPVSHDVWAADRFRFTATAANMNFVLYPGANMGNQTANLESVNVSVTLNAINSVPVANPDTTTTIVNNPVTFNVTNNDNDFDGNIVASTVDLDPATPGIQNTITTGDGTWSVDASGNVTFVPVAGFTGVATIPYTVQDDYTLDGTNHPATSGSTTLTVTVLPDTDGDGIPDTTDLDDDNDGILDTGEYFNGLNPNTDTDGDGIPDYMDTDAPGFVDANGDGVDDRYDTDNDGIPNHLDTDSDGDGCFDAIEAAGTFTTADIDGSGHLNGGVDANGVPTVANGGQATTVAVTDPNNHVACNTFSCATNFYQVINRDMNILDMTTGTYTSIGTSASRYNAIGWDVRHNLIYGIGTEGASSHHLLVVDASGVAYDMGAPTEIGTGNSFSSGTNAGDMDRNGNLYVRVGRNLVKINVDTNTYEVVTFTGPNPGNIADIVYIASTNSFWGAHNQNLYQWDLGTNAITRRTVTGLPNGHYGAAYTDVSGSLYLSNNGGGVYKVENYTTANPAASLFVNSQATNRNDGASCPDALPPNVPPTAVDDPYTVVEDGSVVINPLANDTDVDGDPLTITSINGVALTPGTAQTITVPHGTVTIDAAGVITFTPDADYNGPATFPYEISDGHGGTATANVNIDVQNDNDHDGVPDITDLDDDNDGIPDTDEYPAGLDPNADTDGDGIPDYMDPDAPGFVDTNGDGIDDRYDPDGDGIPNHLDLDSDNDGIPDIIEAGGTDSDGDGQIDYPVSGDPSSMADVDHDGLSDLVDPTEGGTPLANPDTDGDGIVDVLDIDSDNDGIIDNIEAQSTSGYIAPTGQDTDGDGIDDAYDGDDNNTVGIGGGTGTAIVPVNTDNADEPDYLDLDTDNDGIYDVVEGGGIDADGDGHVDYTTPGDATTMADADGDGLADAYDHYDNNTPNNVSNPTNNGQLPTDLPDVTNPGGDRDWRDNPDHDGDGIPDNVDLDDDNDGIPDTDEYPAGLNPNTDTDGDGIPDYMDPDAPGFVDANGDGIDDRYDSDGDGIPNHLDLDSDNDGIVDIVEAGGTDSNGDGLVDNFQDTNNDGLDDTIAGSPLPNPDTDGDGIVDVLDIDSDNDGIVDNIESQSTAGYIAPTGQDDDGDGIDNAYDPDNGGTAIVPVNTDNADEPDYLDLDSDNDGIYDIVEGGGTDADGNGVADNPADADHDGLVDDYDADDTQTNPTNAQTPESFPDLDTPGGDRDWREPRVLELVIDTVLTPNGDGLNDTWYIEGLDNYPDNVVRVYNRWGNLVYEKTKYDNSWDGTANAGMIINKGVKLPVGTYYYVLDLGNGKHKTGFLYLNR